MGPCPRPSAALAAHLNCSITQGQGQGQGQSQGQEPQPAALRDPKSSSSYSSKEDQFFECASKTNISQEFSNLPEFMWILGPSIRLDGVVIKPNCRVFLKF